MNGSLKKIHDEVNELLNQHNDILEHYFQYYWKDDRPITIEEQEVHSFPLSNFDLDQTTIAPEEKKISDELKQSYHKWYSSCYALIERNYNKERTNEFRTEYEKKIKEIISSTYITKGRGYNLIDSFKHQALILQALPKYLKYRLLDVELTVASILMDDELLEAEYLLKKGFIRSAGAVAGVVLERHLKMRCDRNKPKLKYPKKATISKLNDILKNNNLLDVTEWRKVQYLGDIRNNCDHDKKSKPKKEDVLDLISKVKEMIHYHLTRSTDICVKPIP